MLVVINTLLSIACNFAKFLLASAESFCAHYVPQAESFLVNLCIKTVQTVQWSISGKNALLCAEEKKKKEKRKSG